MDNMIPPLQTKYRKKYRAPSVPQQTGRGVLLWAKSSPGCRSDRQPCSLFRDGICLHLGEYPALDHPLEHGLGALEG